MRVIVLGAGVVGLTTAVRLLEAGGDVRVVTAAPIEATTSWITAGIWFPTHVGPPGRVAEWGRRTFEVLAAQARAGVPGAVMRESLALYPGPPGRPDWTASAGPVREASPAELPPGYRYGLRFAVPQAEMPLYQPWLLRQVTELGGEIVTRHVADLAELAEPGVDAVVNCPGLGARELVGDQSVYPVRGQIVRVKNPGLTLSVRDEFHPAGRAYVHPRSSDCILGGTLDEHQWDTAPDPATAESIITRCTEIVPALAGAEVIDTIAGLRRPPRSPAGGEPTRARRRPYRPQLRPRRGRHHAQLGLRRRRRPAAAVTIAGVQARKLGLKPGQRVALDDPPPGWAFTDPPGGLEMIGPGEETADVIVAFFTRAADLGLRLPGLAERIFPDGAVWAAWPRRAGGHTSDITDNVVREYALPLGVVDVKVAAIDDDWSGLRLVWRKENRRRPGVSR